MAARQDKRYLPPTHPDALCFGCGDPINGIVAPGSVPQRTRGVCKSCGSDEPPHENNSSHCRCHFCDKCKRNNAPVIIGTSACYGNN